MVEPAISQLRWLIEKYGDHPRVEILPVAVGLSSDALYDAGDYSTLSTEHRDLIEQHSRGAVQFRRRAVVCIDGKDLEGIAPGPYDFINIDVEGLNWDVLMELYLRDTRMVCIEMDPPEEIDLILNCLKGQGFTNQQEFGGNLLAWK